MKFLFFCEVFDVRTSFTFAGTVTKLLRLLLFGIAGNSVYFNWFTCAGEASQWDMRVHPDSFIMKGEMNIILDYTNIWKRLKNPIILFDRNFDQDSALLFQSKLLFRIAT
jgi:hypothetical protein